MTPLELAEIQRETGLDDTDFIRELDLKTALDLAALKLGTSDISGALADRAERLLDDWRYASLILERKIQPQFDELVSTGGKPQEISLVTQLDKSEEDALSITDPQARLAVFRHVDRLAKARFAKQGVKVVSKVAFITPPAALPGEEASHQPSVLDVKVERKI